MLEFVTGNLLDSEAEALVNTVNTVGVMGKGIALQFKEAFPVNYKKYKEACKANLITPGKLLAVKDHNALLGEKLIINFPTKTHWRQPSKYEYVESGLKELARMVTERGIKSVAVPPLGCGNGGLNWDKVKQLIIQYLGDVSSHVYVFEPNAEVKAILQREKTTKDVKLTPARALLLYLLFYYESLGEYSSLFSANKLAYFLQRMGESMKLKFQPYLYGPYAIGVENVLYHLNGTYIMGLEQKQAKAFEPLLLNYERFEEVQEFVDKKLTLEQKERLKQAIQLIEGFQSELSLEILASVDFILLKHPGYLADEVFSSIQSWNERKRKLFKKEFVEIAYNHLKEYSSKLSIN